MSSRPLGMVVNDLTVTRLGVEKYAERAKVETYDFEKCPFRNTTTFRLTIWAGLPSNLIIQS